MARARSRKRRPGNGRAARSGTVREPDGGRSRGAQGGAPGRPPKPTKPHNRSKVGQYASPTAPTYGERPQAPWHPLPLSELLILVGAIVVVIGLRNGVSNAGATTLAGLAAVAIGTIEVTLREHLSGYRSHTVLLALLPVLIFHSLTLLAVSAFATPPRLANVGLLAIDMALFVFLFKLLRARFLDARHARVLREG
jgi:hypothetical protein